MGIRLQSSFRSSNDDYYKIEIHDTAYSGTAVDVKLGGNGFTLNHDGETDTIFSPIIGSSVSLTIYNDDPLVDAFSTALLNAQDKQFYIRIERVRNVAAGFKERVEADGGTFEGFECLEQKIDALDDASEPAADEYGLFWTGYIVQDLIEEADESKPRAIQLNAADGISLLSTIDYEFSLAASEKTIKEILVDILDSSGISSLFESDEILLTTSTHWWADEHTYNVSNDPMDLTRFDLKIFTEYFDDGSRSYTNALDVIREISKTFGARFYFDTSFRFEQIGFRDNVNIREFRYLPTGTLDDSGTLSLDVSVDQNSVYRSGGNFRFLPAVKRVLLSQQKIFSDNLIRNSISFPADEIDIGIIPSLDNGRVIFELQSKIQTYISSSQQGTATPLFTATIRLEPSDGSATRYWKNSLIVNTLVFGPGSWSTSSDTFKFAGNLVSRSASAKTTKSHTISTGPLPTDGEIYVDIDFLGFYDFGLDPTFIASPNSFDWGVALNAVKYENDNNPADVIETIFSASNTSSSLGSNINVDLGSTRLGDGPGAVGSLYVYDGSDWVPSTGWRTGNSGTYVDVSNLCVSEILALQSSVVKRFEGTTIHGHNFKSRLIFDSAFWIQLRGSYNANRDEYNGEWFKISRVTATTSLDDPIIDTGIDDGAADIFDFSGMYSNVGSGSVGNMPVSFDEESIGPYQQTTTGGKINGSAVVTGDTNLQAGLTHDGFLIQNIQDVTNSAGSSYDVSDTDYMIFNTWTGTTGTATINLPAAADNEGRLLRFKSDGTIAANKIVNLVPQSGDTIDGNGEFAFDRDYDGVMLLAHNDNWFIIQRKAK